MPTPTAGATERNPTHDATLSDGSTTVGLLIRDGNGRFDPRLIRETSYPRTSTQIRQGEQKYSDLELPYQNTAQDDWSGGRGQDRFSDDVTRYLEGSGVDTTVPGHVLLGGQVSFTTGHRDADDNMPGDMYIGAFAGGSTYQGASFVASASYTADAVYVHVGKIGTPANALTARLYSDNGAGRPNTALGSAGSLAVADFPYNDGRLQLVKISGLSASLTSGTTYHVVLSSGSQTETDGWLIGQDPDNSTGSKSNNGTSWTSAPNIYFFVEDDGDAHSGMFFEYKRSMYFVTQPSNGGASTLYVNGNRGAADSNSGALSTLIDASQSWTEDEWIGRVVLITEGPGADEEQPWRKITDNNSTTLTVSPDWNVEHTTATSYVILGSNKWTSKTGLGAYVTDVAVAKDWVYFARDTSLGVLRYREWNDSGTWNLAVATEAYYATYVQVVSDNTNKTDVLWGGYNDEKYGGSGVWKGWIPPLWGDLFNPLRKLTEIGDIWRAMATGTISFSTTYGEEGSIDFAQAIQNPTDGTRLAGVTFPAGVEMQDAYQVAFQIYTPQLWPDNDIEVELYTDPNITLKQPRTANYVIRNSPDAQPDAVVYYDGSNFDLIDNLSVEDNLFSHTFTLNSSHKIYVGYSSRFNSMKFDIDGTTKNATTTTSNTMLVKFWDGDDWQSVAGLSDGTVVANAPFAQDGVVSWTLDTDHDKGTDKDNAAIDNSLYWVEIGTDTTLDDAQIHYMTVSNTGEDQIAPVQYLPDMTLAHDGDANTDAKIINFGSDDYLYIGHEHPFTDVVVTMGDGLNTASETMTAQYWDGDGWATLTIETDGTLSSGKTLASSGTVSFQAPLNWLEASIGGSDAYWIRISSTGDLSEFDIAEIAVKNYAAHKITLGTVLATTWTWKNLTIFSSNLTQDAQPACYGMGFVANDTLGTGNGSFNIRGDVWLTKPSLKFIPIGSGDRVTGLQAYGDQHKNPWVFTDSSVYEIQTEADDTPVPIPLGEIASLRSETNGKASAVNDVYLYFNMGEHVQRYFNRTLENVGFNTDEGLPNGRRGRITSMLSRPGRVYASVLATASDLVSGGYSSVLVRRGGGWHEFWRAPKGVGVYDMASQVIPGSTPDRLWVAIDGHMVHLPLPSDTFNPANDSSYPFTTNGWLITSWIDTGLLDVAKLWKSVKLFSENLSSSSTDGVYVNVLYQKDSGDLDSGWTRVTTFGTATMNTSPFEEDDLASANNVTARRIRFMFHLVSMENSVTPVIKATVWESLLTYPVKYTYTMPFSASDREQEFGGVQDYTVAAETLVNQLKTWANGPPTVLTFRCNYAAYDNKTVMLQPPGLRPTALDTVDDYEEHLGEISILEV